MLLVFDDNEYRRKNLLVKFRLKNMIVSFQAYAYYPFFTKPLITVLINPSFDILSTLCNNNTVTIVAKNDLKAKLPDWIIHIPLDDNIDKEIEKIYIEQLTKDSQGELDIFGNVVFKGKNVGVSGKRITCTDTQMNILKFFYFNCKKGFTDTEASSYFRFRENPEQNLVHAIYTINSKCKQVGREALIVKKDGRFYANPSLYTLNRENITTLEPGEKLYKNEKVHI